MKTSPQPGDRVVVAMSGGVDSSVAAALLKEQGFDVIGVSLKLWDYDEAERKLTGKTCCSLDDIADAKEVCDSLGMPFYAFNHKPEFRKNVIDVFVAEYARGRTPNPCVLCNRNIKFDVLLREAQKLGAKYLATGHYARVEQTPDGIYHLCKGVDAAKDQSYVLFNLSQAELARVLFPIGGYTKAQIRELALKYGLVTHNKKESMEICFIPNNDHADFIAKNYPDQKRKPGKFINEKGEVLGIHRGIDAYTIGQRRGLNVALGERTYVKEIRPKTDEIVLASGDEIFCKSVTADGFHFLREYSNKVVAAKVRYQRDDISAEIVQYDAQRELIRLRFLEPARAVTPGQALVLYDGDEVVGGGWITAANYSDAVSDH